MIDDINQIPIGNPHDDTSQDTIFRAAYGSGNEQLVFDPDRTPYHGKHVILYIASQLHEDNTGNLIKLVELDSETNQYSLQFRFRLNS